MSLDKELLSNIIQEVKDEIKLRENEEVIMIPVKVHMSRDGEHIGMTTGYQSEIMTKYNRAIDKNKYKF